MKTNRRHFLRMLCSLPVMLLAKQKLPKHSPIAKEYRDGEVVHQGPISDGFAQKLEEVKDKTCDEVYCNTTTNVTGGYLVPPEYVAKLQAIFAKRGVARSHTVIPTRCGPFGSLTFSLPKSAHNAYELMAASRFCGMMPSQMSAEMVEDYKYAGRFDWLNGVRMLKGQIENEIAFIEGFGAGPVLGTIKNAHFPGIVAPEVIVEDEPEKPETLMGFPIKWVESPPPYPEGSIILGSLDDVYGPFPLVKVRVKELRFELWFGQALEDVAAQTIEGIVKTVKMGKDKKWRAG